MDDNHYIGDPPTGTVYIGYERGTWPLHTFKTAAHAASWLENVPNSAIRYVWRYELTDPVPMKLVPEVRTPATLKESA